MIRDPRLGSTGLVVRWPMLRLDFFLLGGGGSTNCRVGAAGGNGGSFGGAANSGGRGAFLGSISAESPQNDAARVRIRCDDDSGAPPADAASICSRMRSS